MSFFNIPCKHIVLLQFFIIGLGLPLFSQVTFHQDDRFIDEYVSKSSIAIGMADINGDGWDDIVRLTEANRIELFMFANDGKDILMKSPDDIEAGFTWSMAIANLNNDRSNEIFLGTAFAPFKIIDFTQDDKIQIKQTIPNEAYSQSSTIADINNDGWLDIFVCSDDGTSTILRNDGTGSFSKDLSMIDLNTSRPSDNSGNYGSEWMDIDSDGDLDLYISKCKGGVTNPNDPRRINVLYINDGNQNYEEKASSFGLNFGQQSWASSFADFDNDGDIDGFVAHHGDPHSFMENEDNSFIDRSSAIGGLESFAYQVITRDFDNNGFIDILLCGDKDYIMWNEGDFQFDVIESPFRHYNMMSASVGDVNRDGFLDLIGVIGGTGLNKAGPVNDILWMNDQNQNSYVSFRLNGTESNANGIGARVKIYGEWGMQTRELKAGESYSISNSLNIHFGLGTSSQIDKVEVLWPSGHVDVYENIVGNQYYNITEKGCISANGIIESDAHIICADQTLTLSGNIDSEWSDGRIGASISIEEPGLYFYKKSNQSGCIEYSEPIMIRNDTQNNSLAEIKDEYVTCLQQPLIISYTEPDGSAIEISIHPGNNELVLNGACSEFTKDVTLKSIDAELPVTLQDTIEKGQDVTLINRGQELSWYLSESSAVPIYKGDSITIENIDSDRQYFIEATTHHQYDSDFLGEYSHKGTNQYSGDQLSGGLYFDVSAPVIIEEISVYTDVEGIRTIMIRSEDGTTVYEREFDLTKGRNRLTINANLSQGLDYFIKTDQDANLSRLGFYSPRLVRSNTETSYPYKIKDLIQINNSSFGPTYYLYFYDWQVRSADLICVSDRVPFSIIVESSTSVEEEFENPDVSVYPNPANQSVSIAHPLSYQLMNLYVYNSLGQRVHASVRESQMDTSELPSGLYTIELKFNRQIVRKQLVIQH